MNNQHRLPIKSRSALGRLVLGLAGAGAIAVLGSVANASSPPPQIPISSVPLTLVEPTDPQVLVVVPNSQSMDGDLSGAIMTGSGTVDGLHGSSSPVSYAVPAGFTPPEESGGGGYAPYTTYSDGTLYDNSASRLNVAKQSIQKVLQQYAANFDFGLMTYKTSGITRYTTWVYYMSASGGFTFGDRRHNPAPPGTRWAANPCYDQGHDHGDEHAHDDDDQHHYCEPMKHILGDDVLDEPDMAVAASSDDPDINDVLYANGGISPVCLVYGGHNPPTPFPPNFSLADYNNIISNPNSLTVSYNHQSNACARETGPTNAGYVPYSDQVMYAQRGFGFYVNNQSRDSGDILVGVAPAATSGAPTPAQINSYIAKFTPYLKPETNSTNTPEIKALAIQSPVAGLINCANQYYAGDSSGCGTGAPPQGNNACTPNRYVVMITDGLPTEDLSGKAWPPLGTVSADGYGVHATFNLVGGGTVASTDPDFTSDVQNGRTTTLASTNDQALQDAIDQLGALKANRIQTYIVGMGAGVDPTKNPAAAATMKAMALAGGTSDYFPGITPQDVVNDLQVIFAQIQAANQSTTSVAVNSTSFQTDLKVYQARFDTASFGWTGDLVAYKVNADGSLDQDPADEAWDARDQMKTAYTANRNWWNNDRIVVTTNSTNGAGVAFRWDQLSNQQQQDMETYWDTLTVSEKHQEFGDSKTTYGKAVLNYLRGDQSLTEANGGPFRNRTYLLGDIVDSAPLYVAAPNGSYPGTDYAAFATANANRAPVIYVGSNDGALHAFDAATGNELFAFFPQGPFARLADLSQPSYDQNHEFFVDGSPNAGDIKESDGKWHTLLVGGLNSGGAGIYAMDVTDPSDFASALGVTSDILWDITDKTQGFSHLGLTYSQPQIAEINLNGTDTFVVIFGSGYNNDDGKPYLYVVNAQTGALIKSFDLCSEDAGECDPSLANGLSTPVVVSSRGTAISDRVYAGDLQGHLWRVDLSDPSPARWSATVLFNATDTSGDKQPITTQPVASFAPPGAGAGIMVYFGTGRYLGQPDIPDHQTQDFYGVLDRPSTSGLPLHYGDLEKITLTDSNIAITLPDGTTSNVPVRTATAGTSTNPTAVQPIDWSGGQRGWRMALPEPGERSITDPRLIGGRVVYTTFAPSTAACSAGGYSWLMVVNYANGQELPGPELDINGDDKLNSQDQLNGANPVGLSLGPGYAAAPTLMNYHQGPFNDQKLITISGSPIKRVKERGLPNGVLSWSEIR